ncbi:MAG: polymer-forming cytoskeletal protein [Gammaproteobacteria bacterium]|nr:polymer-forming cytoskeletal protein [Gammaproteobacteria bacterium]MBU1409649.1 polymer-forming cytoskeletal protein [Gammaproteobacteria bacterium]MBU1533503.1 polymer-forming cytoskeletal protein [Gammaproteobacteria bacterium]
MLKNFMQPGNTPSNSRTDSAKPSQSAYETAKAAAATRAETAPQAAKPATSPSDEGSKLIVGPNIKLKGSEITDCEILVVEGRVEASMKSRDIRIAEGGVFSGKAEIDVAEVRGNFEGELTARKRLVIYATGKVSGVIRYGAMSVEEGGTLSGDVAMLSGGPSVAKLADASAQTAAPEAADEKASEPEPVHSGSTYFRNQAGKR